METLSTTEPALSRAPNPAQVHARRQARESAIKTNTPTPSHNEGDSPITVIDKRKFDRKAEGITISANDFSTEGSDSDSQTQQDILLARLEKNLGMSPKDEAPVEKAPVEQNTDAPEANPTPETDSTPERKKKVWFKRLGYAASMNFKIARGIGVKNYAGEIKDSIQTAVSEKIDATKAKIYQKTEATLWKLADEVNAATESISGTYARTKAEIGAEYTAFKQGFTADLENAMGMWLAYREQAHADKAARKKYVNDRIMKYALAQEKQYALAGTRGAGL